MKKTSLLFFFITVTVVWMCVAYKLWQNTNITVVKGNIPSFITKPIRAELFRNRNNSHTDETYQRLALEYLQRRPLDANVWLWASKINQRKNKALEYLNLAHTLSKKNKFVLDQVFTQYIEQGSLEKATLVAKDLSYSTPGLFSKYFYYLARLTDPSYFPSFINNVIPESVPILKYRTIAGDYYYKKAFHLALRMKNDDLADVVWQVVPSEFKLNSQLGLNYLNYLQKQQNIDKFSSVWKATTGNKLAIGSMPETSFKTKYSPCWNIRESKGASTKLDKSIQNESTSLLIEFNGETNINYYHASCLFTVEPYAEYTLSGKWSGKNISTLSGPFLEVYAPGIKGLYAKSEKKIGNWQWSDFSFSFKVPSNINIATLRIRRKKTDYLDSKIAGKVWFKSLSLTKISPNKL